MKTIISIFSFILFTSMVNAQQIEISKAISIGDIESLSSYFDENIDLIVLSTEGIYSKKQTKVILQNFFANNKPKTFQIQHQGGAENAKYYIGSLKTDNGSYRVYFFVKKNANNKPTIQKIRIEND